LDVVAYDTNGFAVPATSGSTNLIGLIQKTIAVTDTDYATASPAVVDKGVGDKAEFEIDVTGGTLTQANVGKLYDLSDARTLNITAVGTIKHFKVVGIKSSTVAYVVFNTAVINA
jgi:hypothetical protein